MKELTLCFCNKHCLYALRHGNIGPFAFCYAFQLAALVFGNPFVAEMHIGACFTIFLEFCRDSSPRYRSRSRSRTPLR